MFTFQGDGILGRARAFSYLLLCSDAHYDVQLLSQLCAQLTADKLEHS